MGWGRLKRDGMSQDGVEQEGMGWDRIVSDKMGWNGMEWEGEL